MLREDYRQALLSRSLQQLVIGGQAFAQVTAEDLLKRVFLVDGHAGGGGGALAKDHEDWFSKYKFLAVRE